MNPSLRSHPRHALLGITLLAFLFGCDSTSNTAENPHPDPADPYLGGFLNMEKSIPYKFDLDVNTFTTPADSHYRVNNILTSFANKWVMIAPIYQEQDAFALTDDALNSYCFLSSKIFETPTICFANIDTPTLLQNSPFVTDSIQLQTRRLNNIRLQYTVMDGSTARELYRARKNLVVDTTDPRMLTFSSDFIGSPSTADKQSKKIYLLCTATFDILEITRIADIFKPEFLGARTSMTQGGKDSLAFHQKFGHARVKSVAYGSQASIYREYDVSESSYSREEIRSALMEYGQSIFNFTGVQSLSSRTRDILKSNIHFDTHYSFYGPEFSNLNRTPSTKFNDSTVTPWLAELRNSLADPSNLYAHSWVFATH